MSISEKEIHESVLEAIEEVKPPSKLREMLMFFFVGFAGGVGLGLLIAFTNAR